MDSKPSPRLFYGFMCRLHAACSLKRHITVQIGHVLAQIWAKEIKEVIMEETNLIALAIALVALTCPWLYDGSLFTRQRIWKRKYARAPITPTVTAR